MTDEQTLNDIKLAKKGNAFLIGSNREIRRLPEYLHQNERVQCIVTGTPDGGRGRGIVVATNERILFIKDGWVFRTNQDYPYETLSTVEFRTGIFFGKLTVFGKGDEATYHGVGRFAGAAFTKLARQLSAAARRNEQNPSSGATAAPVSNANPLTAQEQVAAQLRNLDSLYKDGIITLNEYEIKKQDLLNRL